jgi:putative transposase
MTLRIKYDLSLYYKTPNMVYKLSAQIQFYPVAIFKDKTLKRDAYYKYKSRADMRLKLEQQIINIVSRKRKSLPREGVRKLTKSLDDEFAKANLKIGRDTLFNVLRKHNMLTLRKKTSARKTNSYHRFYKYNNIIKDMEITKPNQVWVSDITYIRTVKGFCYLA